jgi:tetraacyldisaccharide 4'-kinase
MASVLPEVAVAVARRREEGARLALASGPRDVLLLDDGFQHLRVRRDADLLVVNPEAPFWEDTPVPSGRLRERPAAARRAHAFLLIGDDDAARAALAARFEDRPVFTLQRQPPRRWPAAEAPPTVSAATPPGRQDAAPAVPVFAFAGIARPQRFFAELERHEVDVRGRRVFADHHPFRESDLAAVATAARRAGAEMLMTTEKDAVRLPPVLPDIPVHVWGYRLAAREPRRLVDWLRRQANLATRPDAA